MKVVAFNGSPRKDGNTTILIRRVFRELEKQAIETELVRPEALINLLDSKEIISKNELLEEMEKVQVKMFLIGLHRFKRK